MLNDVNVYCHLPWENSAGPMDSSVVLAVAFRTAWIMVADLCYWYYSPSHQATLTA
jgi:hypothetical protein